MPYYLAEIRLNKTSKNVRSERKMRKRLIKHLVIILMVCALIFTPIIIVSVAVGSDQSEVITDLDNLCEDIEKLPDEAFNKTGPVKGRRGALCNKISAVINQIEAGARESAVNKLVNDIENTIENWINDPWKSELISKVESIIEKIVDTEPPVIVDVWREPETPAYNETVTVEANVTDEGSGVESVILSYSIDTDWINITMSLVEELHVGEIPAFPYDTIVYYKIYAYDKAGNSATAGPDSYTVIDPYPPMIGVPTWDPEEPFADEEVNVFVSVSEPANASGIKNVTLWYGTDGDLQSKEMTETTPGNWTVTIPRQSAGVNVTFYIESYDNLGNSDSTLMYDYTVKARPPGLPPVATFTYSPLTPFTGETVTFNATASYDPDGIIVSYEWDFGDFTTGTGNITTHFYVDDGTYTVTLEVTDNDGLYTVFPATVTVLNRLPVVIFTENTTTVLTDEVIHFDASDSSDPDGSIVSYFWNFGDGTNMSGVVVDHAYADDGIYLVTLTVTDNDDASASATVTKTVLNRPPFAIFTESAEIVLTGEVIYFDASGSFDPDGYIVSYFWDFGDGITNATGVTVEHSYAGREIYTVTLTVTDDDGATSSSNATKTARNRPPVADFTASAETVDTGENIDFNATDSYDPDGAIVSYFWNFGDDTNATGVTATHSYVDDGTYIVTLTVTDDEGATDSANATNMVGNRPPVALFIESSEKVLTGNTIIFDAGDSYDPDGTIASYSWNFGDGTGTTGATVEHAYENDGVYTVTLTVTDDDGATASTNVTKTVLNRAPVASFTENATTVNIGEAIHFNASESYDPDGSIVSYFWDFGDNTTEIYKVENLTAIATHIYTEAGNYTVTLTVTDDDGAFSSLSAEKVVEARLGLPWALFAAVGLGIAALAATAIYLWYRRRRRKQAAASPSKSQTKPLVTLYVPAGILAGYEEDRRSE